MTLFNRYPKGGLSGVRLDGEDPQRGRALDLGRSSSAGVGPYTLWVRDANDAQVTLDCLTPDDLVALRDGISSILHAEGIERQITVNVPAFFEVRAHDRRNPDGSVSHVRAHRRVPR